MFATSICFFFPEKQEKTLLFKHLPKSKTNPQALNLILVCELVDFFCKKGKDFVYLQKKEKEEKDEKVF